MHAAWEAARHVFLERGTQSLDPPDPDELVGPREKGGVLVFLLCIISVLPRSFPVFMEGKGSQTHSRLPLTWTRTAPLGDENDENTDDEGNAGKSLGAQRKMKKIMIEMGKEERC